MSSVKKWRKVTNQLRLVLESLPSSEERDELVTAINEIVKILTQLSSSLNNLPTVEEATRAKEALEKLEFILEHNVLLRQKPSKAKQKRDEKAPRLAKISREDIQREIQILTQLSEEEMKKRLKQSKNYSKEFLRLILSELGRRVSSKATKQEMIDQITIAITTKRTYEGLSGNFGS